MNDADFACLWFGRIWGCFFLAFVVFMGCLIVHHHIARRRERRAELVEQLRASMRSHPASHDDWRHDAHRDSDWHREIATADLALWELECSFPADGAA